MGATNLDMVLLPLGPFWAMNWNRPLPLAFVGARIVAAVRPPFVAAVPVRRGKIDTRAYAGQ